MGTGVIPEKELVEGAVYALRSRNLSYGVYVPGEKGGSFIGVREKFDHRFLDEEYAWHTAFPLRWVNFVPPGIPLKVHTHHKCQSCGGIDTTFYVRYAEPIEHLRQRQKRDGEGLEWYTYKQPGQHICLDCTDPRSAICQNRELYEFMERVEEDRP
jgi:hypothetical protein